VALGDVLADYFDAGGRVVTTTFATSSASQIGGRFGTPANGYAVIDRVDFENGPALTLGRVNEPQSPLMTGVAAIEFGVAHRSRGGPINGGVVVAEFSDGRPLVVRGVVNNGTAVNRNIVELNMYAASSDGDGGMFGFWTGDGAALLRNALLFR
jgi:hypothetical protein